jgi:tRNA G18 (ribose-2'-O)-methylase SpoU
VWIPCGVESLNAAIAGSVLLYEAARQNEAAFERGAV